MAKKKNNKWIADPYSGLTWGGVAILGLMTILGAFGFILVIKYLIILLRYAINKVLA